MDNTREDIFSDLTSRLEQYLGDLRSFNKRLSERIGHIVGVAPPKNLGDPATKTVSSSIFVERISSDLSELNDLIHDLNDELSRL